MNTNSLSDRQAFQEPSAEVVRLVQEFAKARGEARTRVFHTLRDTGDVGVDSLILLLKREELRRSLNYRLGGIAFFVMALLLVAVGTASNKNPALSPLIGFVLLIWFGVLLFLAKSLLPTPLEQTTKAVLCCLHETLNDPRAIGPLLEVYEGYKDANLNQWNRLGLLRLLSRFTAKDTGALSPKHRSLLARILARTVQTQANVHGSAAWKTLSEEQADLLVAMLQVVTLTRNKEALSSVRQMAAMEPSASESQQRVQQAAQACLEALGT